MTKNKMEAAAAAAAATSEVDGGGRGVGGSEDLGKGPWSPEEDAILSRLVSKFGARNWSLIARGIAGRSGKSSWLRWCNQLDPGVKRKPFNGKERVQRPCQPPIRLDARCQHVQPSQAATGSNGWCKWPMLVAVGDASGQMMVDGDVMSKHVGGFIVLGSHG